MVDSYGERLRILAPHYVAMIALILLALTIADYLVDDLAFLYRLALAALVAIAYPIFLRMIGKTPEPWQR